MGLSTSKQESAFFTAVRAIATLLPLVALSACGTFSTTEELGRVPSPTGEVEAVVTRSNGGATTAFAYAVHVVPRGAPLQDGERVARLYGPSKADHVGGVNVRWLAANRLAVDYLRATGVKFDEREISLLGTQYQIELRAGRHG